MIFNDDINNKNLRFITKSENYIQTVVKQFIIFTANMGETDIIQKEPKKPKKISKDE